MITIWNAEKRKKQMRFMQEENNGYTESNRVFLG